MLVQERESGHSSTPVQYTEINSSQGPKEVHLDPRVAAESSLEGTGWYSRKEISRIISNYNQNIKDGRDHLEALTIAVSETEANIRTYVVEYIQTKTVLPHLNKFQEVEGVVRMVGRNGVPVMNGITVDERNGSVLQALQRAEDFLSDKRSQPAPNKIAVINSPLGHSGLINEKGKVINYKNNQTMVFWTDEKGELHGLTIVSDLNRKQSRELSIALGVDEGLLAGSTEAEQVANIVGNPALFSYGKAIPNPAKYVFEKILAIRGNFDIKLEQENGADPEFRSVVQTREDIEKLESLLKFKPLWEKRLEDLRKKILVKGYKLDHPIIQAEIVKDIEEAIMDITIDYLQQINSSKFYIPPDNVIHFNFSQPESRYQEPPVNKYAVAAAFLRTRSGCASGGASRAILRGSNASSSASSSSTAVESGNGICPECNQSNLDNHYHCPDCKKKYADETNTERTSECGCGFKFGCGGSAGKEEEQSASQPSAPADLPKAA